MPMVTIRVFGSLSEILRVSELRSDIAGADETVNYVLNSFIKQFRRSLRHELIDSKGELRLHTQFSLMKETPPHSQA